MRAEGVVRKDPSIFPPVNADHIAVQHCQSHEADGISRLKEQSKQFHPQKQNIPFKIFSVRVLAH